MILTTIGTLDFLHLRQSFWLGWTNGNYFLFVNIAQARHDERGWIKESQLWSSCNEDILVGWTNIAYEKLFSGQTGRSFPTRLSEYIKAAKIDHTLPNYPLSYFSPGDRTDRRPQIRPQNKAQIYSTTNLIHAALPPSILFKILFSSY